MSVRSKAVVVVGLLVACLSACSRPPSTPIETFKTYVKAIKAKDVKAMRVLLSEATLKMHERQAVAQGTTVDEIIKRETLFTENQRSVEFRDEKIEGDKATLMVKNSYGSWETVPFIKEDGVWKIDKKGFADRMTTDIEQENDRKLDDLINKPTGDSQMPSSTVGPSASPSPMLSPVDDLEGEPLNGAADPSL
ncbi:MAG: DUF4878 domain-containing protein [Chloracidobacterium sp.]|nr:DUF4878 domain-containing protein [Chloracidobacterium sp.]